MSGISYNPEFADVDNDGYVSGTVSVSSTAVEAKVGANRLTGREGITLTNSGPNTVYYGPSGVTSATGDVLYKNQFVSLPFGETIGVFVVCATGQGATVIVQELA
jgi:hypothetical protein